MPRNSVGTYTLPIAAFSPGTTIISGDMNTDLSDIAAALTQSVATNGVTPMTGPVRFSNGSVTAPSMAFSDAPGVGFYRAGANQLGIAVSSVSIGVINASTTGIWGYNVIFGSVATFASVVSFSGGISTSTTVNGSLVVTGGMNIGFNAAPAIDTIAIGDANLVIDFNAGTSPKIQFDSTDYMTYDRSNNFFEVFIGGFLTQLAADSGAFLDGSLYQPEIAAPASAAANQAVVYVRNPTANARMFYVDENGVETAMGASGYWELIATFTATTSVAAVGFLLSREYARLVIVGTSIQCNNSGNMNIEVHISDNGGTSLLPMTGSIVGRLNGSNISTQTVTGALDNDVFGTVNSDLNAVAEILPANGTGKKTYVGPGSAESPNTSCGLMAGVTDNNCGPINYIEMDFFTGGNISNGKFLLYGMLA